MEIVKYRVPKCSNEPPQKTIRRNPRTLECQSLASFPRFEENNTATLAYQEGLES